MWQQWTLVLLHCCRTTGAAVQNTSPWSERCDHVNTVLWMRALSSKSHWWQTLTTRLPGILVTYNLLLSLSLVFHVPCTCLQSLLALMCAFTCYQFRRFFIVILDSRIISIPVDQSTAQQSTAAPVAQSKSQPRPTVNIMYSLTLTFSRVLLASVRAATANSRERVSIAPKNTEYGGLLQLEISN